MSGPFPGVDPYVEALGLWEAFHPGFLTYCRDALNEILPGHYAASIGVRLELVNLAETESLSIIPDVLVSGRGRRSHAAPRRIRRSGGTATIEPVRVVLPPRGKVEVKRLWIEILRLPGHTPVTVVEVLSSTNKMGEGSAKYLRKRRATIRRKVHLVEVDLLLGGERLPMGEPLPPGDYYALVSRSEERPESDVYAWTMRDPLPSIPIPLMRPDPDVPLDLAAGFTTTYDRGRFASLIDYGARLATVKQASDRAWAERTAKAARR
jgi:hypothetical protein